MFEVIGLVKTGTTEPQKFTLVLKDLENTTKGYTQTTKHGTESQLRELLKESGMSDAKINDAFSQAKQG